MSVDESFRTGDRGPEAGEQITGRDAPRAESALLNVKEVAAVLGCSERHVYRLSDGGRMPRPVKLGALVRWRRHNVLDWIDSGCKPARTNKERR